MKSQLGLKDDEGLVVVHLVEDGPAAKAGVKRHDLVVSAGDKKLRRVPDLVDAVNDGDGKEISLKVLRGGKEQRIFYFSKDQRPEASDLPDGYVVKENPRNGFLTLKRKDK